MNGISIRIYYGIAIALIIHSLDYYYKPTSAIQIDGLNSYAKTKHGTFFDEGITR
ncbi:MAG: hypothetical protein OXT74_11500 [Candidatus Poribacteria bacterium]|nr:hypothetical protein [Candidatus Poribacteria bacterium]